MRQRHEGPAHLTRIHSETPQFKWFTAHTHPDPLHHEADVANAHEVRALVDSIDGFHMAGDLRRKPWLRAGIQVFETLVSLLTN